MIWGDDNGLGGWDGFGGMLPDLMVVWQRDFRVSSVRCPNGEEFNIEPIAQVESRSGDHTPAALLMTNQRYDIQSKSGSVATESIAPTIGRACGIRIPGLDQVPLSRI